MYPDAQRGASSPHASTLAALRTLLARKTGQSARAGSEEGDETKTGRFALGAAAVDERLGGGLARAQLHEIHAPLAADWASAAGFGMALALRAAQGRPLLWARQDLLESEAGRLNGLGFAEFGGDPACLALVRGKDAEAVLRAGVEAARCKMLGAVLIEIWGEPRVLDLTATLRLSRAAETSGATVFLLRAKVGERERLSARQRLGAREAKTGPPPSAAASRWRAQAENSRALPANAPGNPCFSVALLRHRGGAADCSWRLEWLRDQCFFREADQLGATLSGAVAPLSADRPAASGLQQEGRARRAG
jgi:protein ImuA